MSDIDEGRFFSNFLQLRSVELFYETQFSRSEYDVTLRITTVQYPGQKLRPAGFPKTVDISTGIGKDRYILFLNVRIQLVRLLSWLKALLHK